MIEIRRGIQSRTGSQTSDRLPDIGNSSADNHDEDDYDYDDAKDAGGDDDCDDYDHVAGGFYDNIARIKERLSSKLKMDE